MKTINLSILDFKSDYTAFYSSLFKTINLSILDFKYSQFFYIHFCYLSINLSILDFKSQGKSAKTNFKHCYKSIHTGF